MIKAILIIAALCTSNVAHAGLCYEYMKDASVGRCLTRSLKVLMS